MGIFLFMFPLKGHKLAILNGPRQANLVLIAYASSEGSGEPAHPRSLARTFAARSYKQWIKRNLQTESQIPGPSEWLGMRSWNLSWRNARRHKFAWRGPNKVLSFYRHFLQEILLIATLEIFCRIILTPPQKTNDSCGLVCVIKISEAHLSKSNLSGGHYEGLWTARLHPQARARSFRRSRPWHSGSP